jgi:hypothetical protein
MTIDEFQSHDCTLGQESGCTCTKVEIEEDFEDNTNNDNEENDYEDHLNELDDACINDHSRDE